MRDSQDGTGCGGRTLSASGDETMFGVVVSHMAKVFRPNFAAGVTDPERAGRHEHDTREYGSDLPQSGPGPGRSRRTPARSRT